MKKHELKARVAELEKEVAELRALFRGVTVIKATRREVEQEQTKPGQNWPQWVTGRAPDVKAGSDQQEAAQDIYTVAVARRREISEL